ncbi:MAG TPA: 16S rRNA (cytosine(967)-C(5))-methyltransferase RsmB, partial [Candidatus Wallbacteria bacterium]|nr:16S rRNA (cytosine(967)-C(5))-methyltransferase RsmB [Candidatus Wallbacteria bacterium]
MAHRVLIDAPCSCMGIIRRHPELKWRLEEKNIDSLAKIQYQLLEVAASHVVPGGVVVYSVCTFEPNETINLIKKFIKNNSEFELSPFPAHVVEWFKKAGVDTETIESGYQTFFPYTCGMDGFFIARLVKNGSGK